jgi:hypothetical protein
MSNGLPKNLQFTHLRIAAPPEQLEGQTSVEMLGHYTRSIEAIDRRLLLIDRWRERVVIRPAPPQPKSLAELVESARRRLREDRLRDDRDELQARRFVLERVSKVLQP